MLACAQLVPTKQLIRKIAQLIVSLFVTVVLLFAGVFAYLSFKTRNVHEEMPVRRRIFEDVTSQLGFKHGVRYTNDRKELVIQSVSEGKAFHQAGIREGDVILFRSEDTLFARIVFGQTTTVTIPIRRQGKKMRVVLHVPKLDLREDPEKIHWMTLLDIFN